MRNEYQSAATLRRELSARNLARAEIFSHEATYGAVPSIVYAKDETGGHGNFLAASYRLICADPAWSLRLNKSYTASARVPRSADRARKELDCCSSSDALLMNIFCYPRVLWRPELCGLLGVAPGQRPEFGVRARLSMRNDEVDRTEIDMVIGDLLVEAKLTETGFQTASMDRLLRYEGVADIFDIDELPRATNGIQGYQLVRGVLAAHATGGRFVLLSDGRRADLQEMWFRVLRAVVSFDLRSRMALLSWQEVAATLPAAVRSFLATKYGIASSS
ncbi:MAG: hypothetical protein M3R43_02780 [Acidobacteriota bacterium]|nr:hypothetical protein [Acidobacteriota bacterium]